MWKYTVCQYSQLIMYTAVYHSSKHLYLGELICYIYILMINLWNGLFIINRIIRSGLLHIIDNSFCSYLTNNTIEECDGFLIICFRFSIARCCRIFHVHNWNCVCCSCHLFLQLQRWREIQPNRSIVQEGTARRR